MDPVDYEKAWLQEKAKRLELENWILRTRLRNLNKKEEHLIPLYNPSKRE